MSDEKLTLVQRCALLVLMAEARKVPNTHLTKVRDFDLDKKARDELVKAGLIQVDQPRKGGPVSIDLTDKGWRRAAAELGATDVPRQNAPRATRAALYATLDVIRRFLDRSDLAPHEFFVALEQPDLEARIRKAYWELAPQAGAWVMLAKLRMALGPADRADVDATLVRLSTTPDVRLIPESNQKVLTDAERAAAVSIGNQDNHLIAIGS
jgi:hypothetical protein